MTSLRQQIRRASIQGSARKKLTKSHRRRVTFSKKLKNKRIACTLSSECTLDTVNRKNCGEGQGTAHSRAQRTVHAPSCSPSCPPHLPSPARARNGSWSRRSEVGSEQILQNASYYDHSSLGERCYQLALTSTSRNIDTFSMETSKVTTTWRNYRYCSCST